MALIQADHRLTVDEYLELVAAARSRGDDRWEHTELIDGVVYTMMAEGVESHAHVVRRIRRVFEQWFDEDQVEDHGSVRLDGNGLIPPDVFVIRQGEKPGEDDYWNGTQLLLAVEVSATTLHRDRDLKRRDYASGGVPLYYVVNVRRAVVHGYSQPVGSIYTAEDELTLDDFLEGPWP